MQVLRNVYQLYLILFAFFIFLVDDNRWGWCDPNCVTEKLRPTMLLEASLTILHPSACQALFNRSKAFESYDKENELCAGKLA